MYLRLAYCFVSVVGPCSLAETRPLLGTRQRTGEERPVSQVDTLGVRGAIAHAKNTPQPDCATPRASQPANA